MEILDHWIVFWKVSAFCPDLVLNVTAKTPAFSSWASSWFCHKEGGLKAWIYPPALISLIILLFELKIIPNIA